MYYKELQKMIKATDIDIKATDVDRRRVIYVWSPSGKYDVNCQVKEVMEEYPSRNIKRLSLMEWMEKEIDSIEKGNVLELSTDSTNSTIQKAEISYVIEGNEFHDVTDTMRVVVLPPEAKWLFYSLNKRTYPFLKRKLDAIKQDGRELYHTLYQQLNECYQTSSNRERHIEELKKLYRFEKNEYYEGEEKEYLTFVREKLRRSATFGHRSFAQQLLLSYFSAEIAVIISIVCNLSTTVTPTYIMNFVLFGTMLQVLVQESGEFWTKRRAKKEIKSVEKWVLEGGHAKKREKENTKKEEKEKMPTLQNNPLVDIKSVLQYIQSHPYEGCGAEIKRLTDLANIYMEQREHQVYGTLYLTPYNDISTEVLHIFSNIQEKLECEERLKIDRSQYDEITSFVASTFQPDYEVGKSLTYSGPSNDGEEENIKSYIKRT